MQDAGRPKQIETTGLLESGNLHRIGKSLRETELQVPVQAPKDKGIITKLGPSCVSAGPPGRDTALKSLRQAIARAQSNGSKNVGSVFHLRTETLTVGQDDLHD